MKIAKRRSPHYRNIAGVLAVCCLVQACDGIAAISQKDDTVDLTAPEPQPEATSIPTEVASRQPDPSELENATMIEATDFVLDPLPVLVGYQRVFEHTFRLPEATPAPCFLGYQIVTWNNQIGKGAVRLTLIDQASDETIASGRASLAGLQDWNSVWLETPPLRNDTSYEVQIETVEDADFDYGFPTGESSNMAESRFRVQSGSGDLNDRDFGISYRTIACASSLSIE